LGAAGVARHRAPLPTVSGNDITLRIARQTMRIDGKLSRAIGINGTVPAPLGAPARKGRRRRLTVVNDLDEDSSIHWHGLILPFHMDGVPGVSFPGIKPRSTFVYEFPVVQSGTYWYHSHSGLQEQLGHYGPIVIDPAGADPIGYDREHVVVLSDHSQIVARGDLPKAQGQSRPFQHAAPDAVRAARRQGSVAEGTGRVGQDADGSDRCRGRQWLDLYLPRQRPWPARQLDGACSSPASACGCGSSTPLR
jgi:FtsP/CotA-like multicopper oxidase with cupredoxin domain